jgi:hypothetical protein
MPGRSCLSVKTVTERRWGLVKVSEDLHLCLLS